MLLEQDGLHLPIELFMPPKRELLRFAREAFMVQKHFVIRVESSEGTRINEALKVCGRRKAHNFSMTELNTYIPLGIYWLFLFENSRKTSIPGSLNDCLSRRSGSASENRSTIYTDLRSNAYSISLTWKGVISTRSMSCVG